MTSDADLRQALRARLQKEQPEWALILDERADGVVPGRDAAAHPQRRCNVKPMDLRAAGLSDDPKDWADPPGRTELWVCQCGKLYDVPAGADEVFFWAPQPETVAAGVKAAEPGVWARRNEGEDVQEDSGFIRHLGPLACAHPPDAFTAKKLTEEEMYTDPPPAAEPLLPDGRPRCRLFRFGEQCLGPADEEHEHHNPAAVPLEGRPTQRNSWRSGSTPDRT